jgi:YHS domain-containing protein
MTLRLRYEMRIYVFDREACKRIFQENPDRYLDAGGEVLPEPR